jgi:hypothetical protein
LIYGYSITEQWFNDGGTFETWVADDEWELRWYPGGFLWKWAEWPWFQGWTEPILSPCAANAETPQQVIFDIAVIDDHDPTPEDIYENIEIVVARLRATHPGAKIILHPIVGGPNHQLCYVDGSLVAPTHYHPILDTLIGRAVTEGLVDGATISPEVGDCSWFIDWLGHLNYRPPPDPRGLLGDIMGQWYTNYVWP